MSETQQCVAVSSVEIVSMAIVESPLVMMSVLEESSSPNHVIASQVCLNGVTSYRPFRQLHKSHWIPITGPRPPFHPCKPQCSTANSTAVSAIYSGNQNQVPLDIRNIPYYMLMWLANIRACSDDRRNLISVVTVQDGVLCRCPKHAGKRGKRGKRRGKPSHPQLKALAFCQRRCRVELGLSDSGPD